LADKELPVSKVECMQCGEKGHFKSKCPNPPKPLENDFGTDNGNTGDDGNQSAGNDDMTGWAAGKSADPGISW
jgi:hypothetical protein